MAGFYVGISFVKAYWDENISSESFRRENKDLKSQVDTLEKEREKLQSSNEELEREIPKVLRYWEYDKRI